MFSIQRAALLVAALALTAAGAYAAGAAGRPTAQAVRTVFAQAVDPAGVKGRSLALSRVTIPPDTVPALHRHPGTQVAYIERGTLTYTVKHGSVPVYRGAADQKPRLCVASPADTAVPYPPATGSSSARARSTSARTGDRPLVIVLATLFTNGSPSSIPVQG